MLNESLFFSLFSLAAGLNWLLLILFPKNNSVRQLTVYGTVGVLSLCYLTLMWQSKFLFIKEGMSSLAAFRKVLGVDTLLLAGWIHYLAFDLLIGLYINQSSQNRGISRWFVIPCLMATFLVGPVGFLCFLILRFIVSDRINKSEISTS